MNRRYSYSSDSSDGYRRIAKKKRTVSSDSEESSDEGSRRNVSPSLSLESFASPTLNLSGVLSDASMESSDESEAVVGAPMQDPINDVLKDLIEEVIRLERTQKRSSDAFPILSSDDEEDSDVPLDSEASGKDSGDSDSSEDAPAAPAPLQNLANLLRMDDHSDSEDSDAPEVNPQDVNDWAANGDPAQVLRHLIQSGAYRDNFNASRITTYVFNHLKTQRQCSDDRLIEYCAWPEGLRTAIRDAGFENVKGTLYSIFRVATIQKEVRQALCRLFDRQNLKQIPSGDGFADLLGTKCRYMTPGSNSTTQFVARINAFYDNLENTGEKFKLVDFQIHLDLSRTPTGGSCLALPKDARGLVAWDPTLEQQLRPTVQFCLFKNITAMVIYAAMKNLDINTSTMIRMGQQGRLWIIPLVPMNNFDVVFTSLSDFHRCMKKANLIH